MTAIPPQLNPPAQPAAQPQTPNLQNRIPEAVRPLAALGVAGLGAIVAGTLRSFGNKVLTKWGSPEAIHVDPFTLAVGAVSIYQGVTGRPWVHSLYAAGVASIPKLYDLAVKTDYDFKDFGLDTGFLAATSLTLWAAGRGIRSFVYR